MGNTGIVFARDGSAPFLNPATLVWIQDTRVAFSVNFYSLSFHSLDDFHDPRGTARRTFGGDSSATYVQPRVDAIPSTFCLFFTLKDIERKKVRPLDAIEEVPQRVPQKLATCFGTTERRLLSATAREFVAGTGANRTTRTATFSDRYDRVHIGPSYSAILGERLSVGASLHLVRSDPAYSFNAHTVAGPTGFQSSYAVSTAAESYDLALLAGATYVLDRFTTLGLAVQPPTLHIGGTARATQHSLIAEGEGNRSEILVGRGDFTAPLPFRVGMGLGVAMPRVRIELNTTVFLPQRTAFASTYTATRQSAQNGRGSSDDLEARVVERSNTVVDSSVGAEYQATKSISVLGGFATAFDASPPLNQASFGQIRTSRDNRALLTLGLGSYAGGSELFLGMQLSHSWGQALAIDSYRDPNDAIFVRAESYAATLIIAGSTSTQALRRTVEELRKPKPAPNAPPGVVREPGPPKQETIPPVTPPPETPTKPLPK